MTSKLHTSPKPSRFSPETIYPQSSTPILTSPTSKSPNSLFKSDKKLNSSTISINLSFLHPNLSPSTPTKVLIPSPNKSDRRERELEAQLASFKAENEKLQAMIQKIMAIPEGEEHQLSNELKLLTLRFTALEKEHVDLAHKNKLLSQERDKLHADNLLKDRETNSSRMKMNDSFNRQLSLMSEISRLKAALKTYKDQDLRDSFVENLTTHDGRFHTHEDVPSRLEFDDKEAKIIRLESELILLRDSEARSRLASEQKAKEVEKLSSFQKENVSLKDAVQRLIKENQAHVENIAQLKSRSLNDDIVQKVNELIKENQRLSNALILSNKEREDLKAKVTTFDSQKVLNNTNEVAKLNQCIEKLVQENDELTKKLLQFNQTVDSMRIQVTRLTEEKEEYRSRILQLYQATTTIEGLNGKLTKLVAENQRLIEVATKKQHELEASQAKVKELQESSKKHDEMKNQLIISNNDVQRLSKTLKEKVEELEGYKRKNGIVEAPVYNNRIWNKSAIFGDDFVRSEAQAMTKSFSGSEMLKEYKQYQIKIPEMDGLRNYITPFSSDTKKMKGLDRIVLAELNAEKKNLSDSRMTTVKDMSTEESFYDSFTRKPSE